MSHWALFLHCERFFSPEPKILWGSLSFSLIPASIHSESWCVWAMCRLRPIRCFLLPSQDLAAIPDFQSGAMENWGLTTYRESSLLFDAEKSSASSKLGITMIVSHELAHQVYELNHTFQNSINYAFIALLGHRLFILIYEFYGFIFTLSFSPRGKCMSLKH